jgi:hypothetical protein
MRAAMTVSNGEAKLYGSKLVFTDNLCVCWYLNAMEALTKDFQTLSSLPLAHGNVFGYNATTR